MRLWDYLKDRIISIVIIFVLLCLITLMLVMFNCPIYLVVYIPILILIGFGIILLLDYLRRKKFYNSFKEVLNGLDEKYLITDLIEKTDLLEGEIMIDCLYEIDKSMKEHLNKISYQQGELKEYIEMWCHEVKTPVATSLMIVENNANPVTESIKEELVKIENYVEQVLFYARSEDVEKDYIIKNISLDSLVKAVIKRNKKDLINKRIKIELENLDINVASDKKWLEFILNQIINNAIKYVEENPVIKITGHVDKEHVELKVQDNGIGILESEINRVFDKGFTGTIGRVKQKSTGIGLYLCKKLCLRLNHEIKISSSEEGTVVTLIFPYSSHMTLQ